MARRDAKDPVTFNAVFVSCNITAIPDETPSTVRSSSFTINATGMKQASMIAFLLASFSLHAQIQDYAFPNPSPRATISQAIGNTVIEIEYERPLARKRQVFGELVPWDKVWRSGAGHCTKISFDRPVTIEGQHVAAGHYSLFTIPNPKEWVIILNSDTSLYGSYSYDAAKDVARFKAIPSASGRHFEALSIDVDLVQSNAKVYISWTDIQVGFNIETSTAADAMKFIEAQLLSGINKNSDTYFEAAQFLLFQKEHLPDALKFAEKAIQLNEENGAARRVKIEIYEFLQLYPEALNEIKLAIEMEKNKRYEKEEERQLEINYWHRFQSRIKAKQNRIRD